MSARNPCGSEDAPTPALTVTWTGTSDQAYANGTFNTTNDSRWSDPYGETVAGGRSLTLLHEPFHGIHHIKMALPHEELPRHAGLLEPADEADPPPSGATVHLRTDYDWAKIKACYMDGRGPKDVAAIMGVPVNTLAKRITREGWARERRQACAR